MNNRQLGDILNRLLHAEELSLLPRMAESTVFVSWASNDENLRMQRIMAEEREQVGWLVDLINDLGESPTPPTPNAWDTSMHFVDLPSLLPGVIHDLEERAKLCSATAAQVAHHADAAEVVSRISSRHQGHLQELRAMATSVESDGASA